MKVTRKDDRLLRFFSSVKQGEVFEYDDDFCLKTNEIIFNNKIVSNAVSLQTGDYIYIENWQAVIPLPQFELVY